MWTKRGPSQARHAGESSECSSCLLGILCLSDMAQNLKDMERRGRATPSVGGTLHRASPPPTALLTPVVSGLTKGRNER